MNTVTVVGNPKPRSRTLHAARLVIELLTGRPPGIEVDLVEFGARLLERDDGVVADAVATVQTADLLVVASPTYKAAYTGLLKLFLDRFGAGSLARTTAIPLMLGGDLTHSLTPEVFLKPVLSELGASMPTRALYLLDVGAESDWRNDDTLKAWLELARVQLPARLLRHAGVA